MYELTLRDMQREEMEARLVSFSQRVIRLYKALAVTPPGEHIAMQLTRAATSIGANYAEAIRSRSGAEFLSKIQISLAEASESLHWLRVIEGSGFVAAGRLTDLINEASQIVAIFQSTVDTYRRNHKKK